MKEPPEPGGSFIPLPSDYARARRHRSVPCPLLALDVAATNRVTPRSGKTLYVNVQHAGGALGNDLAVTITKDKP